LALSRAGLPEPELNHVVWSDVGAPVLWPDAAYPQWQIALQYEGAHHNGEEQYLRDIRRADVAARFGWLEVRLSRLDLAGEHPSAVRKVRAALESRGRRAR
jgi:very-short-patch-repair endonuclease